MESEISKELHHTIKELTRNGNLKSFGFIADVKDIRVDINGIENNEHFIDLEEEITDWLYENEFMYDATFYPYLEKEELKLNITYTVNIKEYDIDLNVLETLLLDNEEILEEKLGINYELDNLELFIYATINNKSVELAEEYSLIYNVPDSNETIDLSADENLKSNLIENLASWANEESYGSIDMINSNSLYQIKIEIEESYLSTFELFIYDKISLKIMP